MKNKLTGISKLASSAVLTAGLLFAADSVQAHNPRAYHPDYSRAYHETSANPKQPYFSDYHQQDDSANKTRVYQGTNQDFPILFPVITAAMLAALYLLAASSRKTEKPE